MWVSTTDGTDLWVYLAVLVGSILTGIVVRYVHRIALVVQTATVGAALVTAAGVTEELLLAMLVVLGSLTQFGLVLVGLRGTDWRASPFDRHSGQQKAHTRSDHSSMYGRERPRNGDDSV